MEPEYNPKHDFNLNARDYLAIAEGSGPAFDNAEDLARFLGVTLGDVERRGRRNLMPLALAKWRYMCADAMIEARRK